MKILFSINSMNCGGAERVISILANSLAEEHDVEIVVENWPESFYPLSDKVKYTSLTIAQNRGAFFQKIKLLRAHIRQSEPDIIVSFIADHNIVSCLANVGMKSKLIVAERNDPAKRPQKKLLRGVRNVSYIFADSYVFQTAEERDYFGETVRKRSTIIANPVDSDSLPEVYNGEREKKIAVVGRLTDQKRVENVISAFAATQEKHPDYELHIFGDGKLRGMLEEKARTLGVDNKTVFHGKVDNVTEQIKKMELYVLASDFEGMPNALIEALAMGLACVSTDCPVGGPRALIKEGENGLLVPVNDAPAIAAALEKLMSDPALSAKLSANAVDIRRKASVETIKKEWIQCIEQCIGK